LTLAFFPSIATALRRQHSTLSYIIQLNENQKHRVKHNVRARPFLLTPKCKGFNARFEEGGQNETEDGSFEHGKRTKA
ncbi:hypothetical protein VIGAN_10233000, partial [Vigna angularis var. angularis]